MTTTKMSCPNCGVYSMEKISTVSPVWERESCPGCHRKQYLCTETGKTFVTYDGDKQKKG